jgi:hypothetical protein
MSNPTCIPISRCRETLYITCRNDPQVPRKPKEITTECSIEPKETRINEKRLDREDSKIDLVDCCHVILEMHYVIED